MKNLIYLLVAALLTGGCTYINEPVELAAYKGEYSGAVSKNNKSIYLRSVQDLRTDKKVIGHTIVNDKKAVSFSSDVDFAGRYTTGLRYALDLAGYKVVSNAKDADIVLDASIKEVEIVYDDKTFESNLKGSLEVEVVITSGKKITKQNFKPTASKWISPSHKAKDIEPFLYTLFSDNVNQIVGELANY